MRAIKFFLFLSIFFCFFSFHKALAYKIPDSPYDLSFSSIDVSPANLALNQECIIKAVIKNNSKINLFTSLGLSSYKFEFPGFAQTAFDYQAPGYGKDKMLPAGGTIAYTYTGKFTSLGKKTLKFAIDTLDEMDESNEDNNNGTREITVLDPKELDLAVTDISFTPEKPMVNNNITIKVNVKNLGKVSLTGVAGFRDEDVKLNFDGFIISSSTQDAVPTTAAPFNAGNNYVFTYNGYYEKFGLHNISFVFDQNNRLLETDKKNNSTSTSLTVYLTNEEAFGFKLLDYSLSMISSSSIRIDWQTDKNSTGRILYKQSSFSDEDKRADDSVSKLSHSVTINKLLTDTGYTYKIIASNGPLNVDTGWQNFSTPNSDFIEVSSLPTVSTVDASTTVNWKTNLLTDSQVYYKKSTSTNFSAKRDFSLTLNHKIALGKLEPGLYDFYVYSANSENIKIRTATSSFLININKPSTPGQNTTAATTTIKVGDNKTTGTATAQSKVLILNKEMYDNLRGKIVIKVEAKGEAYYINPTNEEMFFLGDPATAFNVMRSQGIGITNNDLNKIPLGFTKASGLDSDSDGLSDILETALGTDKNKSDTDADGFGDLDELKKDFSPLAKNLKLTLDNNMAKKLIGKILLQVQGKGEAWYINPSDNKRYFLGRPADAFAAMRQLGLGVSNNSYNSLTAK